jgi:acetyltransferase
MRPPTIKHVFIASDGTQVTIRSMRPEDRELEQTFVHNLSPGSKRLRFLAAIKDLSPKMLDRLTQVDYPQELALIATIERDLTEVQIGVARYAPGSSIDTIEFAVVVADEWHGRGVGGKLLQYLFAAAREAGYAQMEGIVLRTNSEMLQLANELGFEVGPYPGDARLLQVRKKL